MLLFGTEIGLPYTRLQVNLWQDRSRDTQLSASIQEVPLTVVFSGGRSPPEDQRPTHTTLPTDSTQGGEAPQRYQRADGWIPSKNTACLNRK